MNETIKSQYIHFIQNANTINSLEYLEDKIKRNYGLVLDQISLEITKSRNRIVNAKIAKDDEVLKAQNKQINELKNG